MQTVQICAARKEFPDVKTELEPVQEDMDRSGQKNQRKKNDGTLRHQQPADDDSRGPWQAGNFYLSTYYSSQALAQIGGDAWNHVFPQIVRSLLDEQAGDGSWPSAASSERKFGTVCTTSLAVLSLTPQYQLLPIYQLSGAAQEWALHPRPLIHLGAMT
ncbi:MAG: hypothetical protein ACM3U2_02270 [Deltaproteobacteria bacterium]